MKSFDYMADDNFIKSDSGEWQEFLAYSKKYAIDEKELAERRKYFTKKYAVHPIDGKVLSQDDLERTKKEAAKGQVKFLDTSSANRIFPRDLNTSKRSGADALAGFPKYSARLLLEFSLVTPLLTRDDEPFYLLDNPARKDHIFGCPFLSAAAIKGLSADAYQRAFPAKTDWKDLGKNDSERTHAYRLQDTSALRLFGLADDGADNGETPSQIGQLHFSPAWFSKIQFIVLNPRNAETARGKDPIQMEAIAPEQKSTIEVVYFNPNGSEQIVREDLARWLMSIAHWWSALGLGAKRLAGYGQIKIEGVKLQTVGWSNMPTSKMQTVTAAKKVEEKIEPPANYERYLAANGQLILETDLDALIEKETLALDEKIAELDKERRHTQGKAQSKAIQAWEKAKKNKDNQLSQLKNGYAKAKDYWEKVGSQQVITADGGSSVVNFALPEWAIEEKIELGTESWENMANWILGGANGQ
jgi:CRISPR/Cas system CMR subunit Cmr6 (Cas7 group RAMP superfamily)